MLESNNQTEFIKLLNEWTKSSEFEKEMIEASKQSEEIIKKLKKFRFVNIKTMNEPFII